MTSIQHNPSTLVGSLLRQSATALQSQTNFATPAVQLHIGVQQAWSGVIRHSVDAVLRGRAERSADAAFAKALASVPGISAVPKGDAENFITASTRHFDDLRTAVAEIDSLLAAPVTKAEAMRSLTDPEPNDLTAPALAKLEASYGALTGRSFRKLELREFCKRLRQPVCDYFEAQYVGGLAELDRHGVAGRGGNIAQVVIDARRAAEFGSQSARALLGKLELLEASISAIRDPRLPGVIQEERRAMSRRLINAGVRASE